MAMGILDIQQFGVKLPLVGGSLTKEKLREVIPVFHQWIREQGRDVELLDVADYSHVQDGPGVLLVGHEANFSVDGTEGEWGVLVQGKRDLPSDLDRRLHSILMNGFRAVEDLEQALGEVEGDFRFSRKQLSFRVVNRLVTNGAPSALAPLVDYLNRMLKGIFPGITFQMTQKLGDPRSVLTWVVVASSELDFRAFCPEVEGDKRVPLH